MLNEFPRDRSAPGEKKLTTRALEELTDEAESTGAQKAIDCQRGQEVTMVGTLRSVECNGKGCTGGVKAELFDGTEFGELSTPRILANAPFFRRSDVMDPTPYLDLWRHSAVWPKSTKYTYKPRDADGRLFLEDA